MNQNIVAKIGYPPSTENATCEWFDLVQLKMAELGIDKQQASILVGKQFPKLRKRMAAERDALREK